LRTGAKMRTAMEISLCTSEDPASVSQQLAGQTVVPVVLPLCTAMFLYW
jgi:hypothetical protein